MPGGVLGTGSGLCVRRAWARCGGKAEPGQRTGWTLSHAGHIWGRLCRLGWDRGPWKLCDRSLHEGSFWGLMEAGH